MPAISICSLSASLPLEFREHGGAELNRDSLPKLDQGHNRRKPYACQRYHGCQWIVLPINCADIGGG